MAQKQLESTSTTPADVSRPDYVLPKVGYKQLPTEKVDYFLLVSFDAITDNDPDVMEIVDFPVVKMNARTLETEAVFHSYVKPVIHPKLSYCAEIAGYTQELMKDQPTLQEVLVMFDSWMKKEGLLEKGVNCCFVTCGHWDIKVGLTINCDYLKIDYPDYLKRWINIKTYFQAIVRKKARGMKPMLDNLGLTLDGHHDSRIDDCKNIAKILRELAKRNEKLRAGLIEPRTPTLK